MEALYYGWLYVIFQGQRVRASLDEPYNWRCKWAAVCAEHLIFTGPRVKFWEFEYRFMARPVEGDECHFCRFDAEVTGQERRAA